ncbi:MAG: alpha/beta hydrolase [Rhodospirillales bacterium]
MIQANDGTPLNYEVDDHTDPWERRPVLILLHGNGRNAQFWYQWVPYLSRDFRIVRPDMRGLGKSIFADGSAVDLSVEGLIDDLLKVIGALGVDKVHFCGESMGGILGLLLAAQHPSLIKTLTLVSTPVFIEEEMKERYALGYASRIEAMEKLGIRKWVSETTKITRLPADENPGLYEWYVNEFSKGDPDLQVRMSGIVNQANVTDILKDVKVPVLGLYPGEGQITSKSQERLLRNSLSDFSMRKLPTNYHMVQLLFPAVCCEQLRDFCFRHDGLKKADT